MFEFLFGKKKEIESEKSRPLYEVREETDNFILLHTRKSFEIIDCEYLLSVGIEVMQCGYLQFIDAYQVAGRKTDKFDRETLLNAK